MFIMNSQCFKVRIILRVFIRVSVTENSWKGSLEIISNSAEDLLMLSIIGGTIKRKLRIVNIHWKPISHVLN